MYIVHGYIKTTTTLTNTVHYAYRGKLCGGISGDTCKAWL